MSSRPKRKVKLSSKAADAVRVAADALGGVSDVPTQTRRRPLKKGRHSAATTALAPASSSDAATSRSSPFWLPKTLTTANGTEEAKDRLSSLPEEVFLNIVTHLPTLSLPSLLHTSKKLNFLLLKYPALLGVGVDLDTFLALGVADGDLQPDKDSAGEGVEEEEDGEEKIGGKESKGKKKKNRKGKGKKDEGKKKKKQFKEAGEDVPDVNLENTHAAILDTLARFSYPEEPNPGAAAQKVLDRVLSREGVMEEGKRQKEVEAILAQMAEWRKELPQHVETEYDAWLRKKYQGTFDVHGEQKHDHFATFLSSVLLNRGNWNTANSSPTYPPPPAHERKGATEKDWIALGVVSDEIIVINYSPYLYDKALSARNPPFQHLKLSGMKLLQKLDGAPLSLAIKESTPVASWGGEAKDMLLLNEDFLTTRLPFVLAWRTLNGRRVEVSPAVYHVRLASEPGAEGTLLFHFIAPSCFAWSGGSMEQLWTEDAQFSILLNFCALLGSTNSASAPTHHFERKYAGRAKEEDRGRDIAVEIGRIATAEARAGYVFSEEEQEQESPKGRRYLDSYVQNNYDTLLSILENRDFIGRDPSLLPLASSWVQAAKELMLQRAWNTLHGTTEAHEAWLAASPQCQDKSSPGYLAWLARLPQCQDKSSPGYLAWLARLPQCQDKSSPEYLASLATCQDKSSPEYLAWRASQLAASPQCQDKSSPEYLAWHTSLLARDAPHCKDKSSLEYLAWRASQLAASPQCQDKSSPEYLAWYTHRYGTPAERAAREAAREEQVQKKWEEEQRGSGERSRLRRSTGLKQSWDNRAEELAAQAKEAEEEKAKLRASLTSNSPIIRQIATQHGGRVAAWWDKETRPLRKGGPRRNPKTDLLNKMGVAGTHETPKAEVIRMAQEIFDAAQKQVDARAL